MKSTEKNMNKEYDQYDSSEYDSNSDSEYDYQDDYDYIEYTNEELDYMNENYKGKYVGDFIPVNIKITYLINKVPSSEPIKLNKLQTFRINKQTENKKQIESKKEVLKIQEKENKKWEDNNTNKKENTMNTNVNYCEFPILSLDNIEKVIDKDDFIEVVKKKKSKSSASSVCSVNTYNSDSSFSKMCYFILNKKSCPDGERCKYAHDLEQLVIRDCRFNSECRNIEKKNGKYVNISDKICRFKHENESISDYNMRVNNIKKTPEKVNPLKIKNELPTNYHFVVYKEEKIIEEDKIFVDIEIPIKSNDNWVEIKKKVSVRDKAFETLSDKEKMKTKLNCTKLCMSIINKTKCLHKNCRFAHDIKELVIRDCLFKNDCKYIKTINNEYVNICKTKICEFKHNKETNENYYKRIGYNDIHLKVPKKLENKVLNYATKSGSIVKIDTY
jgi:hypothetical protein